MGRIEKCTIKDILDGKRRDVNVMELSVERGVLGSRYEGQESDLQISMMEKEARDRGMKDQPDGFCIRRFKENLSLSGIDLTRLVKGDRLQAGSAILEITIAGKKCYRECPVYRRTGPCGLDRHAAFAKVVKDGQVSPGDNAYKLELDV